MKAYILDLREERCPMALLIAKRECNRVGAKELVIQICDSSSKNDIVHYLIKQNFSVQIEETGQHYMLTITKRESI